MKQPNFRFLLVITDDEMLNGPLYSAIHSLKVSLSSDNNNNFMWAPVIGIFLKKYIWIYDHITSYSQIRINMTSNNKVNNGTF